MFPSSFSQSKKAVFWPRVVLLTLCTFMFLCFELVIPRSRKIATKLRKVATKTVKHAGVASVAGKFMAVASQVVHLFWGVEDSDDVIYGL